MSNTCCFLLLFFICLSMHACSARRFGALDNKNKLENKLQFSIKNEMKNTSSLMELRSMKEESIALSHEDDYTDQVNHMQVESDHKEKHSGAVQRNKPIVSVSRRVPHRKDGEEHPGFNLDYSRPKTHPPSHN